MNWLRCDRCGRKMDKPAATVGKYHYGRVCFEKMFGKKEPVKRKKKAVKSKKSARAENQLELNLECLATGPQL